MQKNNVKSMSESTHLTTIYIFITFAALKSKEHILLTLTALQHPRNGDRKSMHSFSTTSLKDKEDTTQPV